MKQLTAWELLESENKYQKLVENLHTGVVVHNADTSIMFCNQEASRLLGLSQDQLENKVATDPEWCFTDETGRRLSPEEYPVMRVIATNKSLINQTYGINRPVAGDLVWVQVNAYPEFDEAGDMLKQVVVTFSNITERKGAEEGLKKLSLAVEQSPVSIVITNIEGVIEYANPKASEITGYPLNELIGLNARILKSGETADEAYRELWRTIGSGQTWHGIFHNKKKNGELFWESATISGITNANGIITHYLSVKEDITEIKKAQEQIKLQNERLTAIVGAMPDLVFIIDNEGTYLEFYSSNTESLLVSVDQVIGLNIRSMFDEETVQVHFEKIDQCIQQKKLVTYEYQVTGEKVPGFYEARLSPLGSDKVLALVRNITGRKEAEFVIRDLNANLEQRIEKRTAQLAEANETLQKDISERKQVEKALRESEIKHSSMIFNISDVIGIMLINGMITYKSPNIEKYFGWQPSELIGTSGWLTVHPDDLKRLQIAFLDLVKEDNASKTIEYRYKCKDGSYKPIEMTATNLVHNKVINGILFNYHDITYRKQAEEEIIKSRDEANKANKAKSDFLSRMSHELRTPMNSILGFAQLMKMCELSVKQKKAVDHILNSGTHLLNLIDEVLDISRIESGRMTLMPEPVFLNSLFVEMLELVQPLADGRQVKLELENTPASQLFIIADRKRLKQVLLNLLNNAVKYNRQGGTISVKTEALPVFNKGPFLVRISVADTGPGIPPENISKLFVPFERIGADNTHTEGAGLGLAIVKKIVEAMKGSVGVRSEVGIGSTFWIDLPINANLNSINEIMAEDAILKNLKIVSSSLGDAANLAAGTILYIEDNIQNAELVEEIIGTYRPRIRLITSMFGSPAVRLANQYKPGLILLDLDLPDMNGNMVLTNLQADDKTKSIPVVVISADATQRQVNKLLAGGARGYLTKPLDVNLFLQSVDEWMNK